MAGPVEQDQVLFDDLMFFTSGGKMFDCYSLNPGLLRIEASSPPGRTGESAALIVTNAAGDGIDMRLSTTLDLDGVVSEHRIVGGQYCVAIVVTNYHPDTGDPNRPERPTKQVRMKLTHRSRP